MEIKIEKNMKEELVIVMNKGELEILKLYIEENSINLSYNGKLLSLEKFIEGVEDSIGWDEVRKGCE